MEWLNPKSVFLVWRFELREALADGRSRPTVAWRMAFGRCGDGGWSVASGAAVGASAG